MPRTLSEKRVYFELGPVTLYAENVEYTTAEQRVHVPATDPLELRRMSIVWERLDGGAVTDDRMQTSIHLLRDLVSTTAWTDAEFAAAEAAVDAWWLAIKPYYTGQVRLAEIVFHRAGPAYDPPTYSPGPAVRRVSRSSVGTAAGSFYQLPHQVAISVTERTARRKRWGRMMLPAPSNNSIVALTGRIDAAFATALANATETMYGTLNTSDLVPVVYSRAQPARSTKSGAVLPAHPALALKVNTLQIDDVPDTIRRRRLKVVRRRDRRGATVQQVNGWAAVLIAGLNGAAVVGVAYIGLRQAQVKRELARVNGAVESALSELVGRSRRSPSRPPDADDWRDRTDAP